MKIKHLFCVLICLMFISVHSIAQNSISSAEKLSAFVKNINTLTYLNPQEKVYLHFDNTGYYAGEHIWFKAYTVTAEKNMPTPLSKTLYVELLEPDGNIIETKKIKLENGQGDGDFLLKGTVKAGYYEVRAYTRYMLNFGTDNVFSRVFPIFSIPKKEGDYTIPKIPQKRPDLLTQREESPSGKNVNLSFYPEGGNIIAGLQSKIAFKATGNNGESIDIEGFVYNKQDEQVAIFKTMHQGMGIFEFIPEAGIKYKVKATYNGKEYSFNLPEIQPSGYMLNVNTQDKDYLYIRLQKSSSLPSDSIGISVSCRGRVYFFETIVFTSDIPFDLRLPKEKLPAGAIQITIFNAEGKVLAERLAFNNNLEFTSLTATGTKESYSPFEKITLDFELKDKTGLPIESSFSIAVRDAGTEPQTSYGGNILTSLLLSSEIKGYVENPAYYFEADDRNRRLKLDLLMLVQGWRRYDWEQMAGVKPFNPEHPIEKGILVEGTVFSLFRKKKQENIEVTELLTNDKSGFSINSCITDSIGNFNFLHDIDGVWNMTLQTKEKDKRKDYRVSLHRNFSYECSEDFVGKNKKKELLINRKSYYLLIIK